MNMPYAFKEKPLVKEYLKMFRNIRNNIKSHFTRESNSIYNPFETDKGSQNLRNFNKTDAEGKIILRKDCCDYF